MTLPLLPESFARGDFVFVTFEQRTIRAFVVLASDDARSLAIMFDGFLGGYVGMMPLLWNDTKTGYTDLLTGRDVDITHETERRH